MTQVFREDGSLVPVTVLEVGPCRVLQVKTAEKDGYCALKIGFGEKSKKPTKPMAGVFAKAGVTAMAYVKEVPPVPDREPEPGDELTLDVFEGVATVDVVGTSKGRGYSGTIRRWNFGAGPRSHGCKNVREIGSAGAAFASRVVPGKNMPGQYGNARSKIRNLEVVRLDPERNVLLVKGAVPGPAGGFVNVWARRRGS
jgi:large subunit ribosomal protein L3